ncbi:MAG: hypothetical protein K0S74_543 [Chlamydiales bacterium]|jgi:biopolymer transport protein ExbD|nr:hypothetical protein [Chlamydiales bacterium]
MSRRKRCRCNNLDGQEATINLTPLLDVVFVVLIMFIVVAPMLEMDEVQLANGNRDSLQGVQVNPQTQPIYIHVRKDNTIWINQKIVTLSELKTWLIQAKRTYPNAKPLLFHDKNATFGTYQSIKDLVENAGFKELNVVLQP